MVEVGTGNSFEFLVQFCKRSATYIAVRQCIWRSARNKDNVYPSQLSLLWAPKLTHITFRGSPSITHPTNGNCTETMYRRPASRVRSSLVFSGILYRYPTENCAETMYHHPASRFLQGRNLAEPTSTATCFALRRWIAIRISMHDHVRNRAETTYHHPASRVPYGKTPQDDVSLSGEQATEIDPRRCMNIQGAISTVITKNCSETMYQHPGSEVLCMLCANMLVHEELKPMKGATLASLLIPISGRASCYPSDQANFMPKISRFKCCGVKANKDEDDCRERLAGGNSQNEKLTDFLARRKWAQELKMWGELAFEFYYKKDRRRRLGHGVDCPDSGADGITMRIFPQAFATGAKDTSPFANST
ncbi:hypothetical protein IW261DRAFT_1428383 [Armillaria novae-zelandiae]|uniref:Uncharacterized protein n=1 Tax=Armillaria novae-zelandiae TaxID=153914 RepID=A0AA39TP25_9AGAR|nr:hypothetical protein IW261DRAFT_1428383 [Armillaria novae-zelandiae]